MLSASSASFSHRKAMSTMFRRSESIDMRSATCKQAAAWRRYSAALSSAAKGMWSGTFLPAIEKSVRLSDYLLGFGDRGTRASDRAQQIAARLAQQAHAVIRAITKFGTSLSQLRAIRHDRAPLLSGGSASGLSATGAWAKAATGDASP